MNTYERGYWQYRIKLGIRWHYASTARWNY